MTSYEKDDERYEYAYNSDGMRTSKKRYSDGELAYIMTYVWDGDVLLANRLFNPESNDSVIISYLYDADAELFGMEYNGNGVFAYTKNLQGDIVGIIPLDNESTADVGIEYDAWGYPHYRQGSSIAEGFLIAIMAALNAVGYRGYFFDMDTRLYYLRSRYYDPETGRFINADDTNYLGYDGSPLSLNLFVYCLNNAINYIDIYGYSGKYILKDTLSPESVTRRSDDYVYINKKPSFYYKALKETAYVGASAISTIYPNGVKFYKHCLRGRGQNLMYNYNEAFNQDAKIKKTVISYFFELKEYVIKYYGTKSNYSVVRDSYFKVECSSTDWKLALNSHIANFIACIVYNNSTKEYTAEIGLLAIDLYNFNKNTPFALPTNNRLINSSAAFAIKNTGSFIEMGLAHDFYSYGLALFKLKWKADNDLITFTY